MPRPIFKQRDAWRSLAVLAGFAAALAIFVLTMNVTRELRRLESANSDNVQWSLAQGELEFLELSVRLTPDTPLQEIRRRFDIFYSRVNILNTALVFAPLRKDAEFGRYLQAVSGFVTASLPLIDGPDDDLQAQLPSLKVAAAAVRPAVRGLSTSGMVLFAQTADTQRQTLTQTISRLALALVGLIGVLALLVGYLYRLNRQKTMRERELSNTAQRMNTIISTSLDGMMVGDAQGRLLAFNLAAEAMFGYAAADILGKPIRDIIIPHHLRAAHDAGMRRMKHGGARCCVVGKGRITLEALRASGEVFPIELAIQSASTDDGEIFIAFVRDISVRVTVEKELVAARDRALAGDKAKTDFLAVMSHEIRTPLNGLLGNLSLLRDTALSKQQGQYVKNMETSGRLLLRHVSDVLDITRYDTGKLTPRSEAVNISILVQDIVDSQSGMAAAHGTDLQWAWVGTPLDWVMGDAERLQDILMNLIGNAVKFTKGGQVRVTIAQVAAGRLRFDVVDTGTGIAPELQTRIFDDFVTGSTAYDRDAGGTGLGLGIARRFTSALNGVIGLESVPGEGSRFWVELPLPNAPASALQGTAQPLPAQPMNVLVVEDNDINRVVVRDMLQADGHSVREARDGQEGVDFAHQTRFDLILMDISMPVMDGRTATRAIRAGDGASKEVRIVALTANVMEQEQAAFLTDGMDGVLIKPLSKAALRAMFARPQTLHTALVDLAHNHETKDLLGPANYAKTLVRFEAEVNALITSAQGERRPDFAAECHKVAGSAAVFGATALVCALKALEHSEGHADIHALPALWQATQTLLNA